MNEQNFMVMAVEKGWGQSEFVGFPLTELNVSKHSNLLQNSVKAAEEKAWLSHLEPLTWNLSPILKEPLLRTTAA